MLRYMIEKGFATPCNRDVNGPRRTPLLRAAVFGHAEVVRLILTHLNEEVSPTEVDKFGLDALTLAGMAGHRDVLDVWRR